jgi:Transglycosylase SLT domain
MDLPWNGRAGSRAGRGVAVMEPVSPELVLVCPELRAHVLEQMRADAGEDPPAASVDRSKRPAVRGLLERPMPLLLATVPLLLLTGAWLGATMRSRPAEAAPVAPVSATAQPAAAELTRAAPRVLPAASSKRTHVAQAATSRGASARKPDKARAVKPATLPKALVPVPLTGVETEPAVSLLGPLPDPTPPLRRLAPTVGRQLLSLAQARHVDWALLLARARKQTSSLHGVSVHELGPLSRALATVHSSRPSERESVLAGYYRAVGLDALISGLAGAKPVLAARVLRDPRITVYPGGRNDIASGRVNVRILALLLFLAQTQGQVSVASLVSGHDAGAPEQGSSAHAYGLAVDINALAYLPVLGNQVPGGRLDRALRTLLLLPPEVRPTQLISLLSIGSNPLALADHGSYVHISYAPVPENVPDNLRALWQSAGARYGIPWQVLAAINKIETDNGRLTRTSSAGAVGWMQFLPATWREYATDGNGDGIADPRNPADAIYSAARFLQANGGAKNLPRALFAYNHASWYVKDVLAQAKRYS